MLFLENEIYFNHNLTLTYPKKNINNPLNTLGAIGNFVLSIVVIENLSFPRLNQQRTYEPH